MMFWKRKKRKWQIINIKIFNNEREENNFLFFSLLFLVAYYLFGTFQIFGYLKYLVF